MFLNKVEWAIPHEHQPFHDIVFTSVILFIWKNCWMFSFVVCLVMVPFALALPTVPFALASAITTGTHSLTS